MKRYQEPTVNKDQGHHEDLSPGSRDNLASLADQSGTEIPKFGMSEQPERKQTSRAEASRQRTSTKQNKMPKCFNDFVVIKR